MKKSLLLCVVMMLSVAACDSDQKEKAADSAVGKLDDVKQALMDKVDETTGDLQEKVSEVSSQMPEGMSESVSEQVEAVSEVATEKLDAAVTTVTEKAEVMVTEVTQASAAPGQDIYQKSCMSCHATGAANAPKLGDATAWGPRIAKGKDALYATAINGMPGTAMMARGTCSACSDDDLKAAVDFMVSKVQ